jgi:hypothetical protein
MEEKGLVDKGLLGDDDFFTEILDAFDVTSLAYPSSLV